MEESHAGEIPAWPRNTGNSARGNGITNGRRNNGNSRGCLFGRQSSRCATGHQNVNLETSQLGRQIGKAIVISLAPAKFNGDVLSLDVAEVPQACQKCLQLPAMT